MNEVKYRIGSNLTPGIGRARLPQLSAQPAHIDEVCRHSGPPISVVSSALTMMELKEMMAQVGAMNYVLAWEVRAEHRVRVQ
jgi:predicted Rossmann fold nucleotide-binding protein DprA/Smf involved in DNA uptake